MEALHKKIEAPHDPTIPLSISKIIEIRIVNRN
jgi:hypothetical protein